jgi:hypothetical protein
VVGKRHELFTAYVQAIDSYLLKAINSCFAFDVVVAVCSFLVDD